MKENNKTNPSGVWQENDQVQERCCREKQHGLNTHFTLSVVAVCLSCFTGFFAVPLALAALIFSLRSEDQLTQGRTEEAADTARWAAVFGWLTVIIVIIPIILVLLFGGAILAGLVAFLSAL